MSSESNIIVHPKKSRGKPKVQLINPNMPSAEEKEERDTCSICTNYYTPTLRKKVICKYCNRHTCSKCVEQYL